jgi:hypothetical protein
MRFAGTCHPGHADGGAVGRDDTADVTVPMANQQAEWPAPNVTFS